jgi:hypothetical protein
VLAVGLAAATTEVEDIDGGPTWGCSRQVQQQPPLKLKMSMADPQDVLELEVQERPPSTLRNVNDGPPGGARANDPGAQRLRSPPLGQGGE